MAYDPKDPEDKKIVQGLIDEALAAATAEHESNISGLKAKNRELLQKLREKSEFDPEAIAALETQIEENKKTISKLTKEKDKLETGNKELTERATAERSFSDTLLKENGLTAALAGVKVADAFMPAVKALLSPQISIKEVDGKREAFAGDKPLGDFVKEWSQGDQGKHYVATSVNSGSGAQGGGNKVPGQNVISRSKFNEMPPEDHAAFFKAGGTITD